LVSSHSVWNLYQPLEKLAITKFEIKDTLIWERKGGTLKKSVEKLPLIKEVLITGAIENARKLADMISPQWQTEERFYYLTGNKEADVAVKFLQKNEWKEAESVWKKFSNATAPDLRSKIECNLALAAEMNGDLRKAIEWLRKSLHSKSNEETNAYYNRLLHQPWGGLKY
jgi:tetratricopeptide (TPR) repeat protein